MARFKARSLDADHQGMAWLLAVMLLASLGLFTGWVVCVLRLDPATSPRATVPAAAATRATVRVHTVAAVDEPEGAPFARFSGIGGDVCLVAVTASADTPRGDATHDPALHRAAA